jgi:hypothetical protein
MDSINGISCENLLFTVSGDEPAPMVAGSATKNLKWNERRLRAATTLCLSMEDKIHARYTDKKYFADPVVLWAKFKEDHKEVVTLDKLYLRTKLFEKRLEDNDTVIEYLRS